ncbi:MAG: addiction module protein [Coriobacteriia bacterium]|nr:addiction module protein [Coriobacteriia bacterium]
MTIEEITREALDLDIKERATLARRILNSLETPTEEEIAELWFQEALRRNNEIDAGTAKVYPASKVLQELRAAI